MITDQLYFVQLDVNLRELSPEVLCGRSLNYIASIILRQRGLPFGMSRDYKGLKPIKALWTCRCPTGLVSGKENSGLDGRVVRMITSQSSTGVSKI